MAVNALSFNQLATVLTSIADQATGAENMTPTDTASFVSVANTALLSGYDNVLQAVSQVLSKTIFSVRPYTRQFAGLEVDSVRWGNHIRKLAVIDKDFEDDETMDLTDGQSVDMYKINKPDVLQTNYYGYNIFQKHTTIFKNQLDVAFTGPDEFGRFISMIMSNASDQIEQGKEGVERMTVCNLMGGVLQGNTTSVMHLVTLYNAYAGTELTTATVKQPGNWEGFTRWLVGFLSNLIDSLAVRSLRYHINITGKPVMRHTPKKRMKAYFNSKYTNHMYSSVFSQTFHDNYLKLMDHNNITFWQSESDPYKINLTASYINATGAVTSGAVTQDNIFGVIFDDEAAMVNQKDSWSQRTPMNAAGGYSNIYWHFTMQYLNDFTENAVVLCLD